MSISDKLATVTKILSVCEKAFDILSNVLGYIVKVLSSSSEVS